MNVLKKRLCGANMHLLANMGFLSYEEFLVYSVIDDGDTLEDVLRKTGNVGEEKVKKIVLKFLKNSILAKDRLARDF